MHQRYMALEDTYQDHVAPCKKSCVPPSPLPTQKAYNSPVSLHKVDLMLRYSWLVINTVISSVTKLYAKNVSLDQAISSKVSSCSQSSLPAIFSLQPCNSPCSSSEPNAATCSSNPAQQHEPTSWPVEMPVLSH